MFVINGVRSLSLIWLVYDNYPKPFLLCLDLPLQEVTVHLPVFLSTHLVPADEHAHHIPHFLFVFYLFIGQRVEQLQGSFGIVLKVLPDVNRVCLVMIGAFFFGDGAHALAEVVRIEAFHDCAQLCLFLQVLLIEHVDLRLIVVFNCSVLIHLYPDFFVFFVGYFLSLGLARLQFSKELSNIPLFFIKTFLQLLYLHVLLMKQRVQLVHLVLVLVLYVSDSIEKSIRNSCLADALTK